MSERIVLAFSGGLDTSWCIPHLRRTRDAEIVTVTVDVGGFPEEELAGLEQKSKQLGAERHVTIDAKDLFFDEVVRFLLFGNVLRGEVYPLCVGAERSLQAREVARLSRQLEADSVAHGCTGAGNDQVRFEVALRAVAPELEILAPVRDTAPSREDEARELAEYGFEAPAAVTAYSINSGLWGVTIGGRETLDSMGSIPEEAWQRTRGAFEDPLPARTVTVQFKQGVPVALDGNAGTPVEVIEAIDAIASRHGIGRGIHLGETILGVKGRVAFEAPAAYVLISAHRELEKLTLTGKQFEVKSGLAATYGDLVHRGLWLDPACRDIEAFLNSSQARVTGEVELVLQPGNVFVNGVRSPHSLLAAGGANYGEQAGDWTAEDARGFARLFGLATELHGRAADLSVAGPTGINKETHA